MEPISENDKVKLDQFYAAGIDALQEMEDRKSSLADMAKVLAAELDVSVKNLMKALRIKYKGNLEDERDGLTEIEVLLGH